MGSRGGYECLFLADINHTGSALAFVREAQKQGIRPVVGVELRNGIHAVATLMARNNRGIHEMNRFITPFLHQEKPFPSVLPHFFQLLGVLPAGHFVVTSLVST